MPTPSTMSIRSGEHDDFAPGQRHPYDTNGVNVVQAAQEYYDKYGTLPPNQSELFPVKVENGKVIDDRSWWQKNQWWAIPAMAVGGGAAVAGLAGGAGAAAGAAGSGAGTGAIATGAGSAVLPSIPVTSGIAGAALPGAVSGGVAGGAGLGVAALPSIPVTSGLAGSGLAGTGGATAAGAGTTGGNFIGSTGSSLFGGTPATASVNAAGNYVAPASSSVWSGTGLTGSTMPSTGATGGSWWSELLNKNSIADLGRGVGAISETMANNRGTELDAMMAADNMAMLANRNRRDDEDHLWKNLQAMNYVKSGGKQPSGPRMSASGRALPSFGFGPAPISEADKTVATTLEQQLLQRLNNPPQLRDYDSKMKAGTGESVMNWLGPGLTYASNFLGK